MYHKFLENAYKIGDIVEMIHPARFLFNAGSTPKQWNEQMLQDPHLKVLYFEQDSSKVFSNTDIKGGVVITHIFLWKITPLTFIVNDTNNSYVIFIFLFGTLKITQDNNRNTWRMIPMQDFSSSSDIDWSTSIANIDKQLYKKYNLSDEEINFIETKVKEME